MRFVSATEGEHQPVMFKITMILANEESRRISDSVIPAMRKRTEQGYWTNRAPFGYRVVRLESGATLEPDPERTPLVQRLFELAATGEHGVPALVAWMNEQRDQDEEPIRPWRSTVWTQRTIRHMLKNSTYMGVVRKEKRRSKIDGFRMLAPDEQLRADGKHKPIITPELFAAVQMARGARHRPGSSNATTERYLLSGLIKCGLCGRRMQGHVWHGNSRRSKEYAYRCDQRRRPQAGMRWMDRYVLSAVAALPITEQALVAVRELLAERSTRGIVTLTRHERAKRVPARALPC